MLASLCIASSRVHAILQSLLDLLGVVATVAAVGPLCIDRRAGGSDYSEDKGQRYQSATKSLFHFSPSVLRWKSATVMPLSFALDLLVLVPESTPFMQTGCSG